MRSLTHVLMQRAEGAPDDLAFTELNRRGAEAESITNLRLQRRSAALAAQLQELGLQDRHLLLLVPHGLTFIVSFYGCLLARAVAVPHRLPRSTDMERLGAICRAANIAGILTVRSQDAQVRQLLGQQQHGAAVVFVDEIEESQCGAWQMPETGRDTIGLVQFTSGTIRAPKGVVISHRALLENSQAIKSAFEFRGGEVVVSWLPFTHDMGLIGHVVQPVYTGFRNVFMSPVAFIADPATWIKTISKYRADCSGAPNFAYRLCCDRQVDEGLENVDLSSWRLAYCGAERIDSDTIRTFIARFAKHGFASRSIFPCYGLAESTLFVAGRWGLQVDCLATTHQEYVSVGAPNGTHATIRIVDPATSMECGEGTIGELWVKSTSMAEGYLRESKSDEQSFDLTLNGERGYLRTGDLGYIAVNDVYVVGRSKNLIKVRGVSYAAEDVELTLMRTAQELGFQVHSCAVIGIGASACESAVAIAEIDTNLLGSRAAGTFANLVRQKICDALGLTLEDVLCVGRGELPKTPSGKVKHGACLDLYVDKAAHMADATA